MAKQLDGPVPAVSEAFRHLDWGSQNVASHVGVELRKLARYLAAHASLRSSTPRHSAHRPHRPGGLATYEFLWSV